MIEHIKPYITRAERKAVNKYLKSGRYLTESVYTEQFENELAAFLGVPHVSMVPNGTSALYLSLLAAGVGPGDKVFVPDYTMIATANAVRMVGAEPILVDIDEGHHCMDVATAKGKAKALIYVEINGRAGNLEAARTYCEKNKITFIEDSCQSFGSEHNGRKLGSFGRFAAFSLGFHKIITTGQGGFIVSNNQKDYETIERLKDFGRLQGGNDVHDHLGFNFKFTDLQAVFGLEQLKTIDWRIEKKKQLFEWFWGYQPDHVPWFLEVFVTNRDDVYEEMKEAGISTRKLYPPIHTQKIYKSRKKFPMATSISEHGLWLPSSLHLKERQVLFIKEILNALI